MYIRIFTTDRFLSIGNQQIFRNIMLCLKKLHIFDFLGVCITLKKIEFWKLPPTKKWTGQRLDMYLFDKGSRDQLSFCKFQVQFHYTRFSAPLRAKTIRSMSLALSFSVAKYASAVWYRSVHASKLHPALNSACRSITGCIKPTNVDHLYLLCGIAPP